MILDGDDEAIAQRLAGLVRLVPRLYDQLSPDYTTVRDEITEIGKELGGSGGDPRMQKIAARVRELGGSVRHLESCWDGICGWQF